MLMKHSVIYFFSRGVPSVISFLAILIYTRMLSPESYGNYALVMTLMNLGNIIFFQWLRVSLLRFMPGVAEEEQQKFKNTILIGFLISVLGSLVVFATLGVLTNTFSPVILIIAACNTWILAWFELNQTLYRTILQPMKYGVITLGKVMFGLICSIILIALGFGEAGLLAGIFVGTILSVIAVSKNQWSLKGLKTYDRQRIKSFLQYGLPLTVTFSMTFAIQFSDRFFIGWLKGAAEAGYYAVATDFSNQTIAMLMMIINLGALPLAIKKFEKDGSDAARQQLQQNFVLMSGLAFPVVTGGILLANPIANLLFDGNFSSSVGKLLPFLLIGTLLSGLKAYYFDQSFQIGNKTNIQIIPVFVAALVSLSLNFILIPSYGAMGAAYSSIAAYSVSLVLTWYIGKKIFHLPIPYKETGKIVVSVFMMGLSLLPFRSSENPYMAVFAILIGCIIYGGALFVLDIGKIRSNQWLTKSFRRTLRHKQKNLSK